MADRLTGQDVEHRLALLDDLLGRLEQIPGATAALGLDATRALAEVYGEALARLMDLLADQPQARQAAAADELVGHLLVLHGIHPEPVAERVTRALDRMRPALHGGDVQLAGIDDGVARIQLTGAGCASSAGPVELAVREAVLAVAPELSEVSVVSGAHRPDRAFVPLDAVLHHSAHGTGIIR